MHYLNVSTAVECIEADFKFFNMLSYVPLTSRQHVIFSDTSERHVQCFVECQAECLKHASETL